MSEKKSKELNFKEKDKIQYLQWELDRKKNDIRSFESRLISVIGIDSVLTSILTTFYSITEELKLYTKLILLFFVAFFILILSIQLYLWWPRRASTKSGIRKLDERPDIEDLNAQLNTLEATLRNRAKFVYIALICFLIQIFLIVMLLLIKIF